MYFDIGVQFIEVYFVNMIGKFDLDYLVLVVDGFVCFGLVNFEQCCLGGD